MADIYIPKEIVDNHTTEEVLQWVVKTLRVSLSELSSKDQPGLEAYGAFQTHVADCWMVLRALSEKLAPSDLNVVN